MAHHNKGTSVSEEELQDLMDSRSSTARVPILKKRAEDRLRRQLRDVALRGCSREVKDFAECAKGRTISVIFHCRSLNQAADQCMKRFKMDEPLFDELRRRHAVQFPSTVVGYREATNAADGDGK